MGGHKCYMSGESAPPPNFHHRKYWQKQTKSVRRIPSQINSWCSAQFHLSHEALTENVEREVFTSIFRCMLRLPSAAVIPQSHLFFVVLERCSSCLSHHSAPCIPSTVAQFSALMPVSLTLDFASTFAAHWKAIQTFRGNFDIFSGRSPSRESAFPTTP